MSCKASDYVEEICHFIEKIMNSNHASSQVSLARLTDTSA